MAKQKPKLPKFKVGDKVQVRGEEPSYSFTVGQVSVVHGKKGKRFFYEPRPGSIYSFAEKNLKRVKAIPLAPVPAPAVSGNPSLEVREVIWQGYKIESELDEDGNYILAIRPNEPDGEVLESVGLTPGQVEYLFSIHKQATKQPKN